MLDAERLSGDHFRVPLVPWRRRRGQLEQVLPSGSPLDQCNAAIAATKDKAEKNKRRSRTCTWTLTLGTAAIPVLILLSTQFLSFWLGKLGPGCIAAALFIAASYTQLERPHERWNVYRRYQRTFEAERLRYQGSVAPYDDPETREPLFAAKIAELTVALHEDWARVLPTPDEVAGIGRGRV
jgi:hypothetical protein